MGIIPKKAFSRYQFFPPFQNEDEFEFFIIDYFNELTNTNTFDKFGRKGQKQYGLDVYSSEEKVVIQCKLKILKLHKNEIIRDRLIRDLNTDFTEFARFNTDKGNYFNKFIFVSTFHDDALITEKCLERSLESSITLEYWSWDRLLRQMPVKTSYQYFTEIFEHQSNLSKTAFEDESFRVMESDKYLPLLDQIHNYFNSKLIEMNIVPLHLLIHNYPFRTTERFYPYYSPFSITTNNEELIELINSLEKKGGKIITTNNKFTKGVDKASEKLEYITRKLDEHIISYVNNYRGKRSKEIPVIEHRQDNKAEIAFRGLNYVRALNALKEVPDSLETKIDRAFTFYQIGSFNKAMSLFFDLYKEAEKDKKYIWQTIILFNLSKLKSSFYSITSKDSSHNELKKALEKINFQDELKKLRRKTNQKELFDWVIETKFHYKQALKIDRTFQKIRKHYYSQLKGNWSSNNNIGFLLTEYAHYESFISKNKIVFQHFREFKELTSKFIEGLIICHSFNNNQEGRLASFNDYMFSIMLFYGKAKDIQTYIRQYEIKELIFHISNEEDELGFLDMVTNHLTKFTGLEQGLKNIEFYKDRAFWHKYDEIFCNIMVLLSYTRFEEDVIQDISNKLIEYLMSTDYLGHDSISYLTLFINSQGRFFKTKTLYKLLDLFLGEKIHEGHLLKAVIKQFNKRNEKIELPLEKMKQLTQMCVTKCEVCKKTHLNELIDVLVVNSNEYFKVEIEKKGYEVLDKKFDGDYYYLMALFGVFENKERFYNNFIEFAKPKNKDISKRPNFWGQKANRFPRIDMLLNLSFKKNIDLSHAKFDYFRDIDPYYTWAFDMEKFDYSKFDVEWITEFPYKYYLKKFNQYPIIRKTILEYLSENYNERVRDVLIRVEVVDFNFE